MECVFLELKICGLSGENNKSARGRGGILKLVFSGNGTGTRGALRFSGSGDNFFRYWWWCGTACR